MVIPNMEASIHTLSITAGVAYIKVGHKATTLLLPIM